MNEATVADALRPGASSLLRIAIDHDRYDAIARNSGLWTALQGMLDLHASLENSASIENFLGVRTPREPVCFLELVTLVLMECRRRQPTLNPPAELRITVISDFDLMAFQAIGNTLAEVCWPDRNGTDFSGPPQALCVERLRRCGRADLGWLLLRNYLGNILQSYFVQAGVRRAAPHLPPTTESDLRDVDAQQLIEAGRSLTSSDAKPESIWRVFGGFWDDVRKAL